MEISSLQKRSIQENYHELWNCRNLNLDPSPDHLGKVKSREYYITSEDWISEDNGSSGLYLIGLLWGFNEVL